MADVAADVIAIIRKKVPGDKQDVKLTDKLTDLGIESIDALEMIFDLEEKFGIQIPYNANSAATDFATVGDIVNAIQRLVAENAKPAGAAP